MKKIFAFLGSCLLLAGAKAQTSHPAKKETAQPAMTKPAKGLPPSNTNDKHKGEAPLLNGPSRVRPTAAKPVAAPTPQKKKNG